MFLNRNKPYNLTQSRITEIETDLSREVPSGVSAVVLDSPSAKGYYGQIGRTLEVNKGFKEMPIFMKCLEHLSIFLYICDEVTGGSVKVVHSTRLFRADKFEALKNAPEILDDLKDQVTIEQISNYHGIGEDEQCLIVVTDAARPDIAPTREKPYGLLAYRAMHEYAIESGVSHIFAYMNRKTIRNLGRIGVSPEPLCGRSNYTIPEIDGITFEAYQPFVISLEGYGSQQSKHENTRWLDRVSSISLPIIQLQDK